MLAARPGHCDEQDPAPLRNALSEVEVAPRLEADDQEVERHQALADPVPERQRNACAPRGGSTVRCSRRATRSDSRRRRVRQEERGDRRAQQRHGPGGLGVQEVARNGAAMFGAHAVRSENGRSRPLGGVAHQPHHDAATAASCGRWAAAVCSAVTTCQVDPNYLLVASKACKCRPFCPPGSCPGRCRPVRAVMRLTCGRSRSRGGGGEEVDEQVRSRARPRRGGTEWDASGRRSTRSRLGTSSWCGSASLGPR